MSVSRSVAEILSEQVTLEIEGIDRMYLNVYVPALQRAGGVASFFRFHRGYQFASSALMDPITNAFLAQMEQFAKQEKVPVVLFEKGQRKDDVAAAYRKKFTAEEGVLFIGKAQEKTPVFRTERRRNDQTGATFPWLVRSTAMVNHFYVYCMDRDFGPFFLKFCTYFPYNAKLCLNGHEYVKQQLAQRGIRYDTRRWITGSCRAPTPGESRPSATAYQRRRSMGCCGSGSASCRIPSPPKTGKLVIAIRSPFCKRSSP